MSVDTTKMTTVRWGILGCGDVTEKKSGPAYQKTDGFEVVAVMRRNASKAKDYAKRHGINTYYTDADELINDPLIDAIYIATPPDTHKFYGLKVAEAGKICCIEKPLAPSYEESIAIYEAFRNKDIPLFVAYYRRALPRFDQIKYWIDNKKIGELRHINWHLSKPVSAQDLSGTYNWRTDAKIAAAGYFDDLASHGLDLFTYLLGNIKDVSGNSLNQQGLYSAHDATAASWLHETGVTGTGSWNFGTLLREDKVTLYGSTGKIEFSIFNDEPIFLFNQEGKIELYIENPEHIQIHHAKRMRDHLRGDGKHPSNGMTAAHTSWVMDKIVGTI